VGGEGHAVVECGREVSRTHRCDLGRDGRTRDGWGSMGWCVGKNEK
jgi:hypothetical protein